ncbi:MAG TPA: sensor histidine kinase [Usitatibacter sp.]|jgi:signal transduction histidine kinase|nr:sensor histidine kinase [Usitatibacter sp.]
MADRLVKLFAEIRSQAAQLDRTLQAARGDDALDDVRGEWERLRALLGKQDEFLEDLAHRTRELSSLSAFLQTHYEREKQRLARELHDQLGGILTPAKMDLAWLVTRLGDDPQYGARVTRLTSMIDQGIDLKRRIIENLRPSLLDHLGLAAAVRWYVDETCGAAGLACKVKISKLERLAPDVEIAMFRVVQESIGNVITHARAQQVELILERTAQGVRLAVCDDGVGIANLEDARANSHGLAGMAQRMFAINGTLAVDSREGKGTRVEAFLPIAA